MRDVIQKMLEAEAEAQRIVSEAGTEADRIRTDARRRAQQRAEKTREEARAEADRLIAEAENQARRDRDEALRRAAEATEQEVRIDPDRRREAVDAVVRAVVGEPPPGA